MTVPDQQQPYINGSLTASHLRGETHRPEQTTPYRMVQQHAASFSARTAANGGAELPLFDEDAFETFLDCGILAYGFLRLRCGACGHDKPLSFTCRRRGFRPPCGTRCMSQTEAHLLQRGVTRLLLAAVQVNVDEGHGGAVTLTQRFGSATHLNIHQHGAVLDGAYRCCTDDAPALCRDGCTHRR